MADPALKLFGRTIQLGDVGSSSGSDLNLSCENKEKNNEKSAEDREIAPTETDQMEQNSTSSLNTNQDDDQQASSDNTPEGEKWDTDSPREKGLKKPEKILPCPRCNSLDTKFCYYNNYNVNQPRHFCKNCQRYWTAGGTMRNVPVGAGRRKNKHSVPHFRPVLLPFEPNGTVLKFDSSAPGLDEQMRRAEISPPSEEQRPPAPSAAPMHPPVQYYPGPPWAFSWGVPTVLGPGPAFPFVPAPFWPVPFVALGKHSRDGEGTPLWVPKTLRIDDPDEAAKSSIWSTLGIEPHEGGMFKGCKSKGDKAEAASPSFAANPAAVSRSRSFQEGV